MECYFSEIKLLKTRRWNRLSGSNLCRLMRIAIEGLELSAMDFCQTGSLQGVESENPSLIN